MLLLLCISDISFLKLHIYKCLHILLYIIWYFFIQTCQLLVLLLSHPDRLLLLLSPFHIFCSHKPSPCLRHHTDLNNQLQLLKQMCGEEMHNRGISFEQIATWLMQIMDHRSMSQIICCDHNFLARDTRQFKSYICRLICQCMDRSAGVFHKQQRRWYSTAPFLQTRGRIPCKEPELLLFEPEIWVVAEWMICEEGIIPNDKEDLTYDW